MIFYRDTKNVPRFKKISLNGNKVHLKFCITCGIWRAPRSSHCSPCNHCIMEFDHHCPWIGTCVGLRNYRSFLIFITVLFYYLVTLLINISRQFFGKKISKDEHIGLFGLCNKKLPYVPLMFLFVILTIIGILFTGALFCFHFYLGLFGKTTSELFKFPKRKMGFRDSKQEIFSRLCKGDPPSLTKINRFFSKPTFFLNKCNKESRK